MIPSEIALKPRLEGIERLFVDKRDVAFRRGTAMLISGISGAGKTTFALSLARSLMESPTQVNLLYYISPEINRDRLAGLFEPMRWFDSKDDVFADPDRPDSVKSCDDGKCRGTRVLVAPVELDRPVRSSEEITNFLITKISAHSFARKDHNVVVIVDSLTALLRDCDTPGQQRRQTFEFMHRLKESLGGARHGTKKVPRLAFTILVAEEQQNRGGGIEEFIEYVIRLKAPPLSGTAPAPGSHRRSLEIEKSQGTNMNIGIRHYWTIVTGGAQGTDRIQGGRRRHSRPGPSCGVAMLGDPEIRTERESLEP